MPIIIIVSLIIENGYIRMKDLNPFIQKVTLGQHLNLAQAIKDLFIEKK